MLHVHHEAPRGVSLREQHREPGQRSSHQPYLLPVATPQERALRVSHQQPDARPEVAWATVVHSSPASHTALAGTGSYSQSYMCLPGGNIYGVALSTQTLTPSCCPPTLTHSLDHNCSVFQRRDRHVQERSEMQGREEDEAKERIGPTSLRKLLNHGNNLVLYPTSTVKTFPMLYGEMGSLL